MIVGAAILVGDDIYTAPNGGGDCKHNNLTRTRHCCVFVNNSVIHKRVKSGEVAVQGFITDKGAFLTRQTAGAYALKCGQISEPIDFLFSEDLW